MRVNRGSDMVPVANRQLIVRVYLEVQWCNIIFHQNAGVVIKFWLFIMINSLDKYCGDWNLEVNCKITKMVFREGVKLSKNTKWWYRGERLEGVNKYKYLSVTFTPNLSSALYLKEKAKSAKVAVNSVWNKLISNIIVPKCYSIQRVSSMGGTWNVNLLILYEGII